MLIIGIAGGVASGKSLVTRCLEHFGASILDADQMGHEVLRQPEVIEQLVSRWGSMILTGDQIDRKRLARIVFAPGPEGQRELSELEAITHPRIGQRIQDQIASIQSRVPKLPAIVLDAPVMFKAGWEQLCDRIVFVDAPLQVRQQRATARGWSEDELQKREANQTSIAEKRNRSTDVIDNSGSKHETYLQVRDLWRKWSLDLPEDLDPPSTLFSN